MAANESSTRPIACRAEADYNLWIKFSDGLEGRIFLGNLLELGAFALWRDPEVFRHVRAEPDCDALVWDGGVRLDASIMRADLEAQGLRPPPRPIDTDPAFLRFMVRAVSLAADSLLALEIVAKSFKPKRRRRGDA